MVVKELLTWFENENRISNKANYSLNKRELFAGLSDSRQKWQPRTGSYKQELFGKGIFRVKYIDIECLFYVTRKI